MRSNKRHSFAIFVLISLAFLSNMASVNSDNFGYNNRKVKEPTNITYYYNNTYINNTYVNGSGSTDVNGTDIAPSNVYVIQNQSFLKNGTVSKISSIFTGGFIQVTPDFYPDPYPINGNNYPDNDWLLFTSGDLTGALIKVDRYRTAFLTRNFYFDVDYYDPIYNLSLLQNGDTLSLYRYQNGYIEVSILNVTSKIYSDNIETNDLTVNNDLTLDKDLTVKGLITSENATYLNWDSRYSSLIFGTAIQYNRATFYNNYVRDGENNLIHSQMVLSQSSPSRIGEISINNKRLSGTGSGEINVSKFFFDRNRFFRYENVHIDEIYGYYLDWDSLGVLSSYLSNTTISIYVSNKTGILTNGTNYAIYIGDEAPSYFVGNISASAFIEHASDKSYLEKTPKESKEDVTKINYKLKDGKKILDFETMPQDIRSKSYEIEEYDCVYTKTNVSKKNQQGGIDIIEEVDKKCKTRKIEHEAWNVGKMQLKLVETIKAVDEDKVTLQEEITMLKEELCKKDISYKWCK